jgi:poly(A) polymerase
MGITLDPGHWANPGLDALAKVLGASDGITRLVGGAVRDFMAGRPAKDFDFATRLLPEEVVQRLKNANIKCVPTGLAHGTVTAVLASGPVEITTLRRDVATDGRRATVAFSNDWQEDAARRDFTINAMSADLQTGEVFDYFGGVADLDRGAVRFIGDPLTRIAEDHLRVLRFFRFQARYGKGAPHADSLEACTIRANDLMALSRERIADELLKMLALPDPAPIIGLMLKHRIWIPVLPEILEEAPALLSSLARAEQTSGIKPDAIRRLAALFPTQSELLTAVATRLKLSTANRKRLELLAERMDTVNVNPREMAYRVGTQTAIDQLLLCGRNIQEVRDWALPRFPVSGGAIVARGVSAGPEVAHILRQIEQQWIAENFPEPARALAIADALVAQALNQA